MAWLFDDQNNSVCVFFFFTSLGKYSIKFKDSLVRKGFRALIGEISFACFKVLVRVRFSLKFTSEALN